MNYIIDQNKLNALVNYLAEKPYKEVYQAIEMLRSLKAVEVKAENKQQGDLPQEVL